MANLIPSLWKSGGFDAWFGYTDGELYSYVDLEERLPKNHPLRLIRRIVNEVLAAPIFNTIMMARTHLSLGKDCPRPRPIQSTSAGNINSLTGTGSSEAGGKDVVAKMKDMPTADTLYILAAAIGHRLSLDLPELLFLMRCLGLSQMLRLDPSRPGSWGKHSSARWDC
jgi:hypothetical protein